MKGQAQSYADAQTDAQLAQRLKLKVIMAFLQPLTSMLRYGWRKLSIKMSGINAAMSYNIQNALQGTYPNFTVDYPNALVSKGLVCPALNQVAASTVAGTILFTWDDNSTEIGAHATDPNVLVVVNPEKNQSVSFRGLGERADGTQSVTVPNSFSGDLVHCYIAFEDAGYNDISNSKYAGAVTVA